MQTERRPNVAPLARQTSPGECEDAELSLRQLRGERLSRHLGEAAAAPRRGARRSGAARREGMKPVEVCGGGFGHDFNLIGVLFHITSDSKTG